MACDRPELADYLTNFTGPDPVNAIICPYVQSSGGGLGMGIPLFMLFVMGPLGLGLAVRNQHPGPIVVAGMLIVGSFATNLPGAAAKILAIVIFFAISAVGLYFYQKAQASL